MELEFLQLHEVKVKLLRDGIKMPTKATNGSAGYDLYCPHDINTQNSPHIVKIPLGVAIWINHEFIVGLLVARSSAPIQLANSIGIIDGDYQGELVLNAYVKEPIKKDQRIAQLVFTLMPSVHLCRLPDFYSTTDRGTGGFGSTGKF